MSTFYSSLKFLQFNDQLQSLANGNVVAPVHIRVKPTNWCNHKCWFCAYRTDDLQLGGQMKEQDSIPEDKMISLAREFVEMGVKAVTFSGGGEPLLYKPLPKVIDILAAGGIKVAALTNGSNLKGRMADSFAEHGTWIRISLDAWDDVSYSKSRGVKPHEFSRLIDNIRSFIERKSHCVLGVSFIVGHDNHQHISDVCALLKDCGVNHVKISGAVVSNDIQGNNQYHEKIKKQVTQQISETHDLVDNEFSVLNHYHDSDECFEKNYHTCSFLRFLTVVAADQYVYTCQDKAYTDNGRMGYIGDKSFKEFWFSDENRELLNSFNPSEQCHHHCVSHSKNIAIQEYVTLNQEHACFV
jgi:wyosine [tRNA(Phe)-imidazoG37] synthetase (radical SAM superfamily)